MQHFIYPAPLPPPLPPPTSGRGTILSQEARLHALQIAEEIQAERGSYRKWNEVAKEVNRQFGSNVDGDLVKRQVTSMLRSVQRSGLNSVKRPRKHAEVIQQLLQDPNSKRQCIGPVPSPLALPSPASPSDTRAVGPYRIRGPAECECEGATEIINVEEDRLGADSDRSPRSEATSPGLEPGSSATRTESGSEPGTESTAPSGDGEAGTTTTTTTTTSTSANTSPSSSTTPNTPGSELEPGTTTGTATPSVAKVEPSPPTAKSRLSSSSRLSASSPSVSSLDSSTGDSHSIERVYRDTKKSIELPKAHAVAPPPRILSTMNVDEVYNMASRAYPDIDVEFIRTQEIDGSAFITLTHKELTDFGVGTFGKRNKLLQLINPPEVHTAAPPVTQEYFYGRLPTSFPSPYLEAKVEAGEKLPEARDMVTEKKPPVTKILDLEVVGVRKRYLIERENGAVEVLTPCKLRKYKNLTAAFEHLHPDKLAPISAFSPPFSHAPEDGGKSHPADASATPTAQSPATTPSRAKSAKASAAAAAAAQAYALPPAAYAYHPHTHMYYPSPPPPYSVIAQPASAHGHAHAHPPPPGANLQWISTPYTTPSAARTPEKYHSFHPYTPPTPPK